MPNEIQDLQEQINRLRTSLDELSQQFYKNNFTSHQDFNKVSNFNTTLKVPSYSVLPSSCEVGQIAETGGTLAICSATDTWTVVGTQT